MEGGADEKRMRLRYSGACSVCGVAMPVRTEAIYERATKSVRCVSHDVEALTAAEDGSAKSEEPVPVDACLVAEGAAEDVVATGVAGASARREFERRRDKRQQRVRGRHPRLGGLMLAVSGEAQSTTAWDRGAVGEEKLGRGLDRQAGERVRLLHDRRIPGSRANIDHVAVTASGVFVIDAKRYSGRPRLQVDGGILRPRVERLLVGSRDCTKLVDGALRQVEVVRALLGQDVPVRGVLCFVEADWPLIGGSFTTRTVLVQWPRLLYSRLREDGPVTTDTIARLHRRLADTLPPA